MGGRADRTRYVLSCDDAGATRCEWVSSRVVEPIAAPRSSLLWAGTEEEREGRALALSIVADLIGASDRWEDYEPLRGLEGWAWDLHRAFRARFLLGRLRPGQVRELPVAELAAWVAVESALHGHSE